MGLRAVSHQKATWREHGVLSRDGGNLVNSHRTRINGLSWTLGPSDVVRQPTDRSGGCGCTGQWAVVAVGGTHRRQTGLRMLAGATKLLEKGGSKSCLNCVKLDLG